jgi:hypothetical protein
MKKCLIVKLADSARQQIYFLSDVVLVPTIAKRYSASGTFPVEIGHGRGFCPYSVTTIKNISGAAILNFNVLKLST